MTAQEVELVRQLIERLNRLERRIALADTLELASGGGVYTNEEAQDAVGTILTDTTTIDFIYTDATPTITADVKTDSIANTLLANMAADTIKGRANGAGTGDPTDLTATQVRTIINVASGADVTGTAITALATKTTPVDADAVVITDSAASDAPKRTTWANIKATLLTYFSTLFAVLAGTAGGQTLNGGTAANEDVTIRGTAHATKTTSYVLLQDTGGLVGIGTTAPAQLLTLNAAFPLIEFDIATVAKAYIGVASGTNAGINGSVVGDMVIRSQAFKILFSTDSGTTAHMVLSGSSVGIGVTAPTAKLQVEQTSTTAAIPTLRLKQSDLSEEFIRFETTVGAGNAIDTAALGAYYGKLRVYVEGVGAKWIALYS